MTQPHYQDESVTLWHGDALEVLRGMPDASVDSVVTDPPYGLEFMGREWDRFRAELGIERSARWSGERSGSSGASLDVTEGIIATRNLPTYGGQRPMTSRCLTCGRRDAFRNPHGCGDAAEWVREPVNPNAAPPALLAFGEWCRQWATECLRVLKPGGHMLAFGGSRTWHRLACAVEDAGFEIRDSIAWLYGSGFPKSLDVSKAIDKAAGVEREVIGTRPGAGNGSVVGLGSGRSMASETPITSAATAAAAAWSGWGTALKPAFEPIVVARRPLAGTVAANVLTHGTGAINVDACRVAMTGADAAAINAKHAGMDPAAYERRPGDSLHLSTDPMPLVRAHAHDAGRWPTNVVLDDTQAAELDRQSGVSVSTGGSGERSGRLGYQGGGNGNVGSSAGGFGDTGGASRFFPVFRYEAKAPTSERPTYYRPTCECEDAWPTHTPSTARATAATTAPASSSTSKSGSATTGDPSPTGTRSTTSTATSSTTTPTTSSPSPRPITSASTPGASSATVAGGSRAASAVSSSQSGQRTGTSAAKGGRSTAGAARATSHGWSATSVCGECGAPTRREAHATVKPLDLMRWLVRLVTPPGGVVLEPFAGSGTTAEACVIEGFRCIAIEREADYLPLIVQRLEKPIQPALDLDGGAA